MKKNKLKDISCYQITRPTSAYTVLGRVIALIREEPRRMRMSAVRLVDGSKDQADAVKKWLTGFRRRNKAVLQATIIKPSKEALEDLF